MEKWIVKKVEMLESLIKERDIICKDNDDEVCQLKHGFDKSVWIQSERDRSVALSKFLNTLIKDYYKAKKWEK